MAKPASCGYSDGMHTTDTEEPTAQQAPGWTANDATFGARLALIRQHMGWGNIAKAAKECGVPTDSWRNWEVDGREPHRLVTIALAIATRTGCDYLWLVHGPARGTVSTTRQYPDDPFARVIRTVEAQSPLGRRDTTRPVRQTRPIAPRQVRRPRTPVAV